MKQLLYVILALGVSLSSLAQDKIDEAILKSTQTMTSDNEQMNAQFASMGEMSTTIYIKDKMTRTELSSPMTGTVVNIVDGNSNKMLMLMDNPMAGKIYKLNDINLTEEDKNNIEVTKGDQTKTILGYECQQYIMNIKKDGMDMKMNMYSTDAINAFTPETAQFGELAEGFPLYMEVTMNQMGANINITHEVTVIEKASVPDDKFNLTPPEGYKEAPQM